MSRLTILRRRHVGEFLDSTEHGVVINSKTVADTGWYLHITSAIGRYVTFDGDTAGLCKRVIGPGELCSTKVLILRGERNRIFITDIADSILFVFGLHGNQRNAQGASVLPAAYFADQIDARGILESVTIRRGRLAVVGTAAKTDARCRGHICGDVISGDNVFGSKAFSQTFLFAKCTASEH